MIAMFPTLYPDELLYSGMVRYYIHSGNINYSCAAQDLFINPRERPNILFTNALLPEVIEILEKQNTWESIILDHTMFLYYARFLPYEKQIIALKALIDMDGDYFNKLSITPNRRGLEGLRYCPECYKEDIEKYGEAYWHRIHQIPEVTVCSKHGCKLHSTIKSNRIIRFITVEENYNDTVEYGTEKEIMLAKYISEIIDSDYIQQRKNQIGDYLISKLRNTDYVSPRCQQIELSKLFYDFHEFYPNMVGLDKQWQISKLLHNERINPFEIAQVAMFLEIPVEELVVAECHSEIKGIDKQVLQLLKMGESYYRIARNLNVSRTLVRNIANEYGLESPNAKIEKTGNYHKIQEERKIWLEIIKNNPNCSFSELRSNPEYFYHMNWLRRNDKEWTDNHYPQKNHDDYKKGRMELLDKQLLPKVKKAIEIYKEMDKEKPKKISISLISNIVGVKGRKLNNLKRCRAEIEKYYETQEEYWIRGIVWAISKVKENNEIMNLKHIQKYLCINKAKIEHCLPYIEDNCSLEYCEIIYKEILK